MIKPRSAPSRQGQRSCTTRVDDLLPWCPMVKQRTMEAMTWDDLDGCPSDAHGNVSGRNRQRRTTSGHCGSSPAGASNSVPRPSDGSRRSSMSPSSTPGGRTRRVAPADPRARRMARGLSGSDPERPQRSVGVGSGKTGAVCRGRVRKDRGGQRAGVWVTSTHAPKPPTRSDTSSNPRRRSRLAATDDRYPPAQ